MPFESLCRLGCFFGFESLALIMLNTKFGFDSAKTVWHDFKSVCRRIDKKLTKYFGNK
jgi:hypothetical protein